MEVHLRGMADQASPEFNLEAAFPLLSCTLSFLITPEAERIGGCGPKSGSEGALLTANTLPARGSVQFRRSEVTWFDSGAPSPNPGLFSSTAGSPGRVSGKTGERGIQPQWRGTQVSVVETRVGSGQGRP